MGRGQPQYTMVTKQRRKSGCLASIFHLIGGLFTLGVWPLFVWLTHLFGPKQKQVARVYGPPQQPYPPQYGYGQPPPQLPPATYPPQPTMRQRPAAGPGPQPAVPPPTVPPPGGQSYRWDPVTQQWVSP